MLHTQTKCSQLDLASGLTFIIMPNTGWVSKETVLWMIKEVFLLKKKKRGGERTEDACKGVFI